MKKTLRNIRNRIGYWRIPKFDKIVPDDASVSKGEALVIPPDGKGSVGDEAMMAVVREVLSGDAKLVALLPRRSASSFDGYPHSSYLSECREHHFKTLLNSCGCILVIGADIMDGKYSYVDSVLRLRLVDFAARRGKDARVLGFSFNASPHPVVLDELRRVHPAVRFFLRDEESKKRFERLSGRQGELVADVAFGLVPSTAVDAAYLDWRKSVGVGGQIVVGVNINPMFALDHGAGISEGLIDSVAHVIQENRDVAFVLIPHDYRVKFGDVAMLSAVQAKLDETTRKRVFMPTQRWCAADIKSVAATLDFVITGRMHLAVAALGSGVPAYGITYQGKFEGLLRHFGLSGDSLISPNDASVNASMAAFFSTRVTKFKNDTHQVGECLQSVKTKSRLNFDGIGKEI